MQKSPLYRKTTFLVQTLLLCTFITEYLVLIIFAKESPFLALLNSILLFLILQPMLYFVFFRPFNKSLEYSSKIENELRKHKNELEELVQDRVKEIECIQDITIDLMISMIEFRDYGTGQHAIRTQKYIKALAEHLSKKDKYKELLPETTIFNICKAAPLHDIGKIAIPDSILLKTEQLTPEEFDIVKNTLFTAVKLSRNKRKNSLEKTFYTMHGKWQCSTMKDGTEKDTWTAYLKKKYHLQPG